MYKELPAFEIDNRVHLSVERELAAFIGSIILNSNTKNTAAIAFGHQLRRLADKRPVEEEVEEKVA